MWSGEKQTLPVRRNHTDSHVSPSKKGVIYPAVDNVLKFWALGLTVFNKTSTIKVAF